MPCGPGGAGLNVSTPHPVEISRIPLGEGISTRTYPAMPEWRLDPGPDRRFHSLFETLE